MLRTVEDARDFNGVFRDLIDKPQCKAEVKRPVPVVRSCGCWSPQAGKILQAGATVVDGSSNTAGGFRIVALNAFANTFQVFRQRPTDLHQVCRNRWRRWPTCSWVRYSPRLRASSPRFTASTKRASSWK